MSRGIIRSKGPVCLALALGLGLGSGLAGSASAQGRDRDVPPVSDAPPGMESVKRGVQGPEGMLHARVLLHVNTSSDAVGEPISLAPDLYYAFTDTFQVGIVHNLPMGWLTRPGAGLCLTGEDGGCRELYDNVGLDTLLGLAFGDFHFSLHTGLYALRLSDPSWVMLTVGAATKLHFSEDVALFLDPQLGLSLNERSLNDDWLFLPAELQFQLNDRLVFKVLSGITGPLEDFGDVYQIPLGLGIVANLSPALDLGLRGSFDNLLGQQPEGADRTDASSIAALMHIRFD